MALPASFGLDDDVERNAAAVALDASIIRGDELDARPVLVDLAPGAIVDAVLAVDPTMEPTADDYEPNAALTTAPVAGTAQDHDQWTDNAATALGLRPHHLSRGRTRSTFGPSPRQELV